MGSLVFTYENGMLLCMSLFRTLCLTILDFDKMRHTQLAFVAGSYLKNSNEF